MPPGSSHQLISNSNYHHDPAKDWASLKPYRQAIGSLHRVLFSFFLVTRRKVTMASAKSDDPYISLEDVYADGSLNFAAAASEACLTAQGDPTKSNTQTYKRVLEVLEADDRIPFVSRMGTDMKGEGILYNLWKDSKVSWLADPFGQV